jgi:beta-RFAP synthase
MPAASITVSAPSRLHFGLLAFGGGQSRQFGGAGAMIRQPGLALRLTPAERLEVRGPLAERAEVFARRFAEARLEGQAPNCRLDVLAAPPEHVGLGVGTQLGLAVAAGLAAWSGQGRLTPAELAASVGRGRRSAVGAYGFCHGGLIVEAGRRPEDSFSPLVARIALPPAWRFLLVRPADPAGLSGTAEEQAFQALPPVPREVTARLCQELLLELLPAARAGDFGGFSASLRRYGHAAGLCFAARQGGAYASVRIAALAERIRGLGVEGVGQSSWGPTLFAALPSEAEADRLAAELASEDTDLELLVAEPAASGATVEVAPADSESAGRRRPHSVPS